MGTLPSPVVVGVSVGSAASQLAIGPNLTRKGLFVFNASSGTVIWVCPATTASGATQPAAVNGPGSIPVQPQQGLALGGDSFPGPFTNALNAIAAAGTQPLSIWEFYP